MNELPIELVVEITHYLGGRDLHSLLGTCEQLWSLRGDDDFWRLRYQARVDSHLKEIPDQYDEWEEAYVDNIWKRKCHIVWRTEVKEMPTVIEGKKHKVVADQWKELYQILRENLLSRTVSCVIGDFLQRRKVKWNPTTNTVKMEGLQRLYTPRFVPYDDDDFTKEEMEMMQPYLEAISSEWWSQTVTMAPFDEGLVTELEVTNTSGFNPDCRSHRGDDFLSDFPIPSNISKKPLTYPGYHYYSHDVDDVRKHNYVLTLDRKYHQDYWYISRPTGITWGDVMEGVLRTKGSKYDMWYELLTSATVSFSLPHSISLSLAFDHGS